MNEQEEYMACEEQNNILVPESYPWIQPSSSSSLLGLPEMSIQPSISSEVELFADLAEPQDQGIDQEDTQSEGAVLDQMCSNELKRTRSAQVHKTSERKRRDKIAGKIRELQELMPHCEKKDKASILEEAGKYVKALKLQVETLAKAQEGELLARCMPCVGTPCIQFPSVVQSVPIRSRPGIGTCACCSGTGAAAGAGAGARYILLPSVVNPFSTSTLVAYPFLTSSTSSTILSPTATNCFGDTQSCPDVQKQNSTVNHPDRSASQKNNS